MRSLLIGSAVMVCIAVCGCGSTRPASEPKGQPAAVVSGSSLSGASAQSPPREFVSILEDPRSWNMSLYSSSTGALTRRLASFSEKSWTNNGLAFAPDGSAVYFTLIPQHARRAFYLRLMRLGVATRHQTFIANGAQPALSQDGTQIAYATFPHGVAVRDLATGRTRTIGLTTQLGKAADLLNGVIGWLANGSEIAIIPSAPAWDLVGRKPPPAHWCGTTTTHAVIVFVHIPAWPQPLSADCVHLGTLGLLPPAAMALAGDPNFPTSLMVAANDGNSTRVERISRTGSTTRLLTIRDSLPVALDPTGTHLMYLAGHNPPSLWEATVTDGHLTDRRRLPKRIWGSIAW